MNQKKRTGLWGFLAGVLCTAFVFGIIHLVSTNWWVLERSTAEPGSSSARAKVSAITKLIGQEFMGDYELDNMTETMYKGLVAGLGDPYSCYYTKEEYEAERQESSGHYQGIGVTMQQDAATGDITVISCVDDGPAADAGIRAGDIIRKVEDQEVQGYSLSVVGGWIKLSESDRVSVTIEREGEEGLLTFDIEKVDMTTETVSSEMLEDNIGYIAVSQFLQTTPEQFEQACKNLQGKGMKRLIIDLRNNPGGLLSSVCRTLEQILPEGMIVYTEDKAGQRVEYTCAGETPLDIPMVLLVNGNSASAAEIFAGAVKDYGIGTLVGTTTFGKGIVQRTFDLPDGSAVKITVSKYFTPKGNNIHGIGIEPDIVQEGNGREEDDVQLKKAVETVKTLF